MAEKAFEPGDPMALTGVAAPLSPGEAGIASEEMARTFVEEYALMGLSDAEILGLFTNPRYRFTHAVYLRRGPDYVRGLIRGVRGQENANGQGL